MSLTEFLPRLDNEICSYEKELSFCIPVMGRLDDLQATLKKNLEDNCVDSEVVEFIVICFDKDDETESWVNNNFKEHLSTGYLRFIRSDILSKWHFCIAKNQFIKHMKGRIMSSLDGDNLTGFRGGRHIIDVFNEHGGDVLFHQFQGDFRDGTCGRVSLTQDNFVRIKYDESFMPRMYDELDLIVSFCRLVPLSVYVCYSGNNVFYLHHRLKEFYFAEKFKLASVELNHEPTLLNGNRFSVSNHNDSGRFESDFFARYNFLLSCIKNAQVLPAKNYENSLKKLTNEILSLDDVSYFYDALFRKISYASVFFCAGDKCVIDLESNVGRDNIKKWVDLNKKKGVNKLILLAESLQSASDLNEYDDVHIFLINMPKYCSLKGFYKKLLFKFLLVNKKKKKKQLVRNEFREKIISSRAFITCQNNVLIKNLDDFLDLEYTNDFKKIITSGRMFIAWHPTSDTRVKEIWSALTSIKYPCLFVERGALPNTVVIDPNGFLFDSSSYSESHWHYPLSADNNKSINNYFDAFKNDDSTLEIQNGFRITKKEFDEIINGHSSFNYEVVFVPLQLPNDKVIIKWAGWVGNIEGFLEVVAKLARRYPEKLFLVKPHPLHEATILPSEKNIYNAINLHYKDCISYSSKVLTINSGVGLQSMIWMKPVIIVGKAFYSFTGCNFQATKFEDVSSFLSKELVIDADKVKAFLYYLKFVLYSDCLLIKNGASERLNITDDVKYKVVRVLGVEYHRVTSNDVPPDENVENMLDSLLFSSQMIRHIVHQRNFNTALDIGSGDGKIANILRYFGKVVYELDYNKSIYSDENPDKDKLIIGDFMEVEFDQKFDCVVASHVLEHQKNVNLFLLKIFDILEEGGVLAISVPPLKHQIVGGHLSLWNAGLLLYNLVIAGFDCKYAWVRKYGYNISIVLEKKPIEVVDVLAYDSGDIDRISAYLPEGLSEGFNGDILSLG